MIDEMHVRDIALIEDADVRPARGLTVVTGETGAGKTALLSSLQLLSGERADAGMVREGAKEARVEGRFFFDDKPSDPASEGGGGAASAGGLTAHDAPDSDGVVVSRTFSAEGRSRVRIDGRMASVGELARTVGSSIDLCGQHEHQRLMRTENHRAMLDAWAGKAAAGALSAYQQAFDGARAAHKAVEAVVAAGKLGSAELDQARFTVRRVEEVAPGQGEYEELKEKLPILENAEQLKQAVNGAYEALSGDDGAIDRIAQAAGLLDDMAQVDPSLGKAAQTLRDGSYAIEDVARDLSGRFDDIDYDQGGLEDMQERMGQLQDLMHTWGPTMDQVFAAYDKARETVSAVEGYQGRLDEARKQEQEAEERLAKAAKALHEARAKAAPGLARAATEQMSRLQLSDAQLGCRVDELDRAKWTRFGADEVEFTYRPGKGVRPQPLAKIASGGEVSRVTLALKVVLGEGDDVDTLVFDEVDAGVGGSAARSLAQVLYDLSRTHQVIVVTHLAQVAVMGDAHYAVRKTSGDVPVTVIEQVRGQERQAEVARMLSGDEGRASLEHAKEMLDEAERDKKAVSAAAPARARRR